MLCFGTKNSPEAYNDGDFNLDAVDKIDNIHYEGTTLIYVDLHAVYRTQSQLALEKPKWDMRVTNP